MSIQESRRRFLYQNLVGVGGIALMELLYRDLFAPDQLTKSRWRQRLRITPRRQRVAFFCQCLGEWPRWTPSIPSRH